MYDELARIERNYGCVAEYNRCMEEEMEYKWEQQAKLDERCKANKEKIKAAGDKVMYFCDDCYGCPFYEDIGPTSWSEWNWDDVTHGICKLNDTWTCRKRR